MTVVMRQDAGRAHAREAHPRRADHLLVHCDTVCIELEPTKRTQRICSSASTAIEGAGKDGTVTPPGTSAQRGERNEEIATRSREASRRRGRADGWLGPKPSF